MRYKKRIVILLFSLILLILSFSYKNLYQIVSGEILHVKVLSESQIKEKIGKLKETKQKPNMILYMDHEVMYDKEQDIIYVSQTMQDALFEGKLTSNEGKLFLLEDSLLYDKKVAMARGYTFTLYWVSAKRGCYSKYGIVFTGMPLMDLLITETYEDDINNQSREVNVAKVRLEDPYHEEYDYQTADGNFYIRGGSSRDDRYIKKSYKLNLTNGKKSFLGLRKDDDWILNALYDDAGMIHNKLSYVLWNDMAQLNHVAKDASSNIEYVELFIEHEYRGVYALTERIDKKQLSLTENDILYKSRSDRILEEHNLTNEDTDGLRPIFILKYPKDSKKDDWLPIKQWSDMFCKEQFDTYDEGISILNMENAIEYNLYCLLICGSDNMRKNIFFIAERKKDGNYQMIKVPWDLNATWGNCWVDDSKVNNTLYTPNAIRDTHTWCTDISTLQYYDEMQIAKLQLDAWKKLRKNVFTKEYINSILDEQFAYLHGSGAYDRNYKKYTNGIEYWNDAYIYEYVDKRLEYLDEYLDNQYHIAKGELRYVFQDVDYTDEFNPRYYWEQNEETMREIYDFYDENLLLEHYALYGKAFGLKAKRNESED